MALPKLNDTPKYDLIIPSMNKKTRFRPYLVKEEKVLLIAAETGDINQITRATLDLIKSCLEDEIDVRKLTSFDAEYLFLQIRSKSVGETAELILLCAEDNCEHENRVTVNLNDVEVEIDKEVSNIIELTDKVSIEMKYLSYFDIMNIPELRNSETDVDRIYNIIINSIEAVLAEDERVVMKEESKEAIEEFVNGMTSAQFEKLRKFVLNMPELKLDIKYKCGSCGHDNKTTVRGLASFFE
jgi:hypothetical protein